MKKIKFLIPVLAMFLTTFSEKVFAQVNYENTYLLAPTRIGQEIFLTNLGNNNYKYVIYNYDSASFSLYNLNHTPFMLNIPIPVRSDTLTNTYYRLGYVTTTLFDCDSTNIEYAVMLDTPRPTKHPNFAVYRTDGTLIFSKDTVGTIFCVGCGSGSYEMRPIMNTSLGAKLYLFNYDSTNNERFIVYGLCGIVPETINEINQSNSFVQVYPNPSLKNINFEITLPSSFEEYEFTIFNSNFQTVNTSALRGIRTHVNLDNTSLSGGTYFFSLQNKNKVFQTGKFIISK